MTKKIAWRELKATSTAKYGSKIIRIHESYHPEYGFFGEWLEENTDDFDWTPIQLTEVQLGDIEMELDDEISGANDFALVGEEDKLEEVYLLHEIDDEHSFYDRQNPTAEDWYQYYTSEACNKKFPSCGVLDALWAINREAKRLRDMASEAFQSYRGKKLAGEISDLKKQLYRLKSQVIAHAEREGLLANIGGHLIDGNYFALYTGGGYRFHTPAVAPEALESVNEINCIESKPKEACEAGLAQAVKVLEAYLKEKELVEVYELPARKRARVHDDFDDYEDSDEDDYDDGEYGYGLDLEDEDA